MSSLRMKSEAFKDPQTEREDEDGDDLMLLRPSHETQDRQSDSSDSKDSSEE